MKIQENRLSISKLYLDRSTDRKHSKKNYTKCIYALMILTACAPEPPLACGRRIVDDDDELALSFRLVLFPATSLMS